MTYFLKISVGAFTKGLGFEISPMTLLQVAVFHPDSDRCSASPSCASRSLGDDAMQQLSNIFWLGTKELRSFFRDFVLLGARDLHLLLRCLCAGT